MESNDVKTKTGKHPVRTFFCALRWLAIVLLAGLVIAGLYVQAPWKITALFAVLLAGLTVITGKFRKVFWLGVSAGVIVLAVLILIPEKDDGQWKPWSIQEEIDAFNARFALPPEDNAATIYNAVFAMRDWNEIEKRISAIDPDGKTSDGLWEGEQFPEMAELLKELAPEFEQLHLAAQKEVCYFHIAPSLVLTTKQLKRLSAAKEMAMTLNRRIRQLSNPDQIKDSITLVKMGQHFIHQPTFIDLMTGLSIQSLGHDRLSEIVIESSVTDEHIEFIKHSIKQSSFDFQSLWPDILAHEILTAKEVFALMYQTHPSGKVRFVRVRQMLRGLDIEEDVPIPNTYWASVLEKLAIMAMWSTTPSTPKPVFEKIDNLFEPLTGYSPSREDMIHFSQMSFEIPSNIESCIKGSVKHTKSMMSTIYFSILPKVECQRKGVLLLCELRQFKEKHQRWPQSLDELLPYTPEETLIDPVSGGRFVYELKEDGFELYSPGVEQSEFDPESNGTKTRQRKICIWPKGNI